MNYADLQSLLKPLVATGWPAAATLAADTRYDVVGGTTKNPAVPITLDMLEAALAAQLPGAPLRALLGEVAPLLDGIADQFLDKVAIDTLSFQTGAVEGGTATIASFAIALDPTGHTAQLGDLTLEDYGLQLNYVPLGTTLIWSPMLSATCEFLGVSCGLTVGLFARSITITLSEGDSGTIDTILGHASPGTTTASAARSLNLGLDPTKVTLALFQANAELGASPEFDCAIELDLGSGTASWGDFALTALAFSFTHGGGDTSIDAKVIATVGGFEVDGEVTCDSAKGAASLTASCPAIGVTVAQFWDELASQLGATNPVPFLDDVLIDTMALSFTHAAGQTSFEIDCGGLLEVSALGAPLSFTFSFASQTGGQVAVTLSLAGLEFDFVESGTTRRFTFKGPEPLPLAELVAAAHMTTLTDIATDLNLTLNGADLILVRNPSASGNHRLIALDLSFNAAVHSSVLSMITGGDAIGCTGATLFGADAAWSLDQLNAVGGGAVALSQPVPQGVSAIPVLTIGSASMPVALTPPAASNTPSGGTAPPAGNPYAGVPADGGTWYKIEQQVGPVYLSRIGFELGSGPRITLMADAAFSLGPLTAALSGFDVTVPYPPSLSGVSVSLRGLDVSYDNPPLTISGGLLVDGDLYVGDLLIKTEAFLLGAIGEYGQKDGHTSLALFGAMTDPPLGGPVFCFVEGLAAGFGYNSKLNLPATPADVANFALVQVAAGTLPATNPFGIIEGTISPSVGDDWIAVGLVFRSFEVVQSVALLTATFGNDLQFAIVGQSEISLPPASDERIAYAQVDVIAHFSPSDGTLSVAGSLTPSSYVLSHDCHISGGFIYLLKGDGDFVISYGGFAPGYDYQSLGYPDVPRLGLSWRIDSHTAITGEEYCALTPAAMMAGGGLHATWDCGIFSAWFDVSIDILIQWRPFHYVADFSMSLGVSFDLKVLFVHIHFSFHIGASISIHGPPFGGHAHIDLDVISFDIDFGADDTGPGQLEWGEFRAMLPGDATLDASASALVSAKVTDGLVKDCTANTGSPGAAAAADAPVAAVTRTKVGTLKRATGPIALDADPQDDATPPDWVVNGTHFAFTIQSSLPITRASTGPVSVTEAPTAAAIGILPMAQASAEGTLDVTITGPAGLVTASSDPSAEIHVEPIVTKGAPALWGTSQPGDTNVPPIDVTSGYVVKGGIKPCDQTRIVDVAYLLDDDIPVQATSDRAASATPFV